MNDLLQEYLYEYEIFTINQEANEQLFQIECGLINESLGLISINEALIDTLSDWFKKIMTSTEEVIQKLQTKLEELYENQLKKFEKIIESPNRTDPEILKIPITNYHGYDFTKFRDGTYDANRSFTNPDFIKVVAGIVGGGNGEKPQNVDKKSIIKAIYPSLYDENLSMFDKMKEGVVTTGKDSNQETILTAEILDSAWDFVSEEYLPLIKKIREDKDAVLAQKKNVDAAVQQITNMIQSQGAPKDQQQIKKESFVFCEEYITEAPTDKEKEKPIKTQKIDDGNNGVGREVYIKTLMTYIQVAIEVISTKTKIVNTAFMDKLPIIVTYARRSK